MAPADVVVPMPPASPRPPETPPSSPQLPPSEQVLAVKDARHFLELLKTLLATQTVPAPGGASQPAKTEQTSGDKQQVAARASKLEFKTVNEIWDSKTYEYKIAEPLKASEELTDLDQYVFVVRQRIDKETMDPTYYVDIKSEGLRDILRTVLRDIRAVNLNEDKPAVEQNLCYNYLHELESYQSNANTGAIHDPTCLKHLDLLVDYIKTTYRSTAQRLLSLLANEEITFDLLWALFKPNSMVYTTCFGTDQPRCVIYNDGEEKETDNGLKYYKLECRYLDYDGQTFGEASINLTIAKFRGRKRISTLKAFPLQYHPDEKAMKAHLVECGRKFVSMLGSHHRHCQGTAFYMKEGERNKVSVDSRVMLDAAFFMKMNPNYTRPQPGELVKTKTGDDKFFDLFWEPSSERGLDQIKDNGVEPTKIEEKDLSAVRPYQVSVLEIKCVEFAVADIKDIKWSSSPFEFLTIPDEQKEVIIALAETRLGLVPSVPFDDFVTGKGRGLNVLLHGTPGVGKTLTAEAVSEHLQRPLYSISAGDLSLDSAMMEIQLSRVFQTASHWNALILLDEADVYMERRSKQDVSRNKLVSVFLRKLEYCEGIMFLTTNRVSDFDEAILSRIHLMLKYDELCSDARSQIWKHLLHRANTSQGVAVMAPKELEHLATTKFNGRQIKNVITIAHALATKEKSQVAYSHVLQAAKASEDFIREFNGTGITESLYC